MTAKKQTRKKNTAKDDTPAKKKTTTRKAGASSPKTKRSSKTKRKPKTKAPAASNSKKKTGQTNAKATSGPRDSKHKKTTANAKSKQGAASKAERASRQKARKKTKVVIVGAGPGGLTAGMLLASRGFQVEIYEKQKKVGGRNSSITAKKFKFDIGPTFLMLKPILDEVFAKAGVDIKKYLTFYELDPMYTLVFKDKTIKMSRKHKTTRKRIASLFPGQEAGFDKLLTREKKRYDLAYPCLQKDYSRLYKLFDPHLIKAMPALSLPNTMHSELGKYFSHEDLKMAFTFQSKYLGMSPWDCPAAFMIIPYIEHNFGIQHVKGGLSEISEAMKKVIEKKGGKVHLGVDVKSVDKDTGTITLANKKTVQADKLILNADVGHAFKHLTGHQDLTNKKFSCSTFMLYLGIDAPLKLDHHTVYFSDDYKAFVDKVFKTKELTDDISFYVRNASKTDPTVAPKGKSNIYVLVPVPNNKSGIDWKKEKKSYRELVFRRLEEKTKLKLRSRVIYEKIITPADWEKEYNVFLGATFNLAHNYTQMLYYRPHNQITKKTYLVGGGTHPGSGLPTIYESGRIAADLISTEQG